MLTIWHWLLNITGTHWPNSTSQWYNFWSGFGSDIGEVTLIAMIVTWYKHNQCHVDKCHKRGKYPFQHYKLCKRHHPNVPDKLTHHAIIKLNKENKDAWLY